MKLSRDGELESDEIEIIRRDSGNALEAVNNYRYTALRMFNYRVWPEAGEIRDELDKLDKLPLYEINELLGAAGFASDQ